MHERIGATRPWLFVVAGPLTFLLGVMIMREGRGPTCGGARITKGVPPSQRAGKNEDNNEGQHVTNHDYELSDIAPNVNIIQPELTKLFIGMLPRCDVRFWLSADYKRITG